MINPPKPENGGTWTKLKTVAAWLFGGAVALYVLTFIAWKLGFDPQMLFGVSERTYAAIEPVRWWLALVRIGVMFAVWWFWPALVNKWFPETLAGFEKNRAIWMALRHKVFVMFLFLEGCIHVSYLGGLG